MVFGKNPRLPDVFDATLPELEGKTHSEVIAMHLNSLQSAREAFIKSQACHKVKMALSHRVRSNMEIYKYRDKVYYKDDKYHKWQGPGRVIGQDKQVVFVRHGSDYHRIPTCRLKKAEGVVIQSKTSAAAVSGSETQDLTDIQDNQTDSDSEDDIVDEVAVPVESGLNNEEVTDEHEMVGVTMGNEAAATNVEQL